MKSTTITRHAYDLNVQLKFAEEVLAVDSGAQMDESGRWYSTTLKPKECDTFAIDESMGSHSKVSALVLIGKQLTGGVLWVSPDGPERYHQYISLLGGPSYNRKFCRFMLEWATGITPGDPT